MSNFDVTRVVLSGSFRRNRPGLERAYQELISNGCQVLSPHRMNFDDQAFARDVAETDMSVQAIEEHHLLALKQSDFVWVHAPSGYIGLSAAFEVGFACALGVPVFSREKVSDPLLGEYVHAVPSVFDAKMQLL